MDANLRRTDIKAILTSPPGALHTTGQVAAYLGVTVVTIRNRVERGLLVVSAMAGDRMMFTTAEIRRYIDRTKEIAEIRAKKGPNP